ncbi:hypothetical protein OG539_39140 [Actinacidiphila glaucinigra]|uniref:hypothetical protein n=1 Tax=Actinacidiphila glaucinigra TaxID=235986 RepID=UPI002DD849F2|nr:hypothetical protein [Actinacidiphila glaucinigra]WSD58182.1 hypothetical protein OIE69_04365 [Actinacidiphila glaucinigra]
MQFGFEWDQGTADGFGRRISVRLAQDVEADFPEYGSCRRGGPDLERIPPHDPQPLTKFC